jgi:hypothetical protein
MYPQQTVESQSKSQVKVSLQAIAHAPHVGGAQAGPVPVPTGQSCFILMLLPSLTHHHSTHSQETHTEAHGHSKLNKPVPKPQLVACLAQIAVLILPASPDFFESQTPVI